MAIANKYMAKKKISEFKPQEVNSNKHTARGLGMLQNSMQGLGFIGAMTFAEDGECFDGSARLETAYEVFGEDVEPIIIRSKGDRPIIHIREDIPNASDPRAKKLSVLANRIAEVDLAYDTEILASLAEEVDLSDVFFEDELTALLSTDEGDREGEELNYSDKNKEIDLNNLDSSGSFKFSFEYAQYLELIARFNEYKSEQGISDDNQAFARLLDA